MEVLISCAFKLAARSDRGDDLGSADGNYVTPKLC